MSMSQRRRLRLAFALTATAIAAAGLVTTVASALPGGTAASGSLSFVDVNGLAFTAAPASDTVFQLRFDQQKSYCNGDGVAGYRWNTFIVPSTTDPATVTFPAGAVAAPSGYVQALRGPDGHMYLGETPTTVDDTQGFINLSINLTFASAAYGKPAGSPGNGGGEFWIGVACTADTSGNSVEYWARRITVTPADTAGPNKFTFAPAVTAPPATTVPPTTVPPTTVPPTTVPPTTVPPTTVPPTTVPPTTVPPTTVPPTTVHPASSTSSSVLVASGAGSGSTSGGQSGSGSSSGNGTSSLPISGSSDTIRILLWATLLLIFGRMAVLAARPVKVLPARQ